MFKVEGYQNPYKLLDLITLSDSEIHITNTSELSNVFFRAKGVNTITYSDFEDNLYKKWNNKLNIIKMSSVLRRSLMQIKDKLSEKIYKTALKEMDNYVEAFRYLIDIDVYFLDENLNDNEEEKLFKVLFESFINDEFIQELSSEKDDVFDKEEIKNILNSYFVSKNIPYSSLENIDRIYIYNMDYIHPKRIAFLDKVEECGIEVIFRIPAWENVEYAFRPWKDIYRTIIGENKFKILEETRSDELMKNPYTQYVNGNLQSIEEDNIDFLVFASPINCRKYIEKNIENENIIAFSDEFLKETFRGALNKKEHSILEIRVGKFFTSLYRCNIENDNIKLNYEDYISMITSGVIDLKAKNVRGYITGVDAISFLDDLRPYMEGIQTLDEILNRIDALELLNEVSDEFDAFGEMKTSKDRVKQYLLNPLKVFSYVNKDRYEVTIKQLRELTLKLKKIIESLIVDNGTLMDINNHIEKLKETIKLSIYMKNNMKEVYEEILKKLSFVDEYNSLVYKDEMKGIISLLLDNKKKDENTSNILSFSSIEAMLYKKSKLTILDASESSFSNFCSEENIIPKYITEDVFSELIEAKWTLEKQKELYKKSLEVCKFLKEYRREFIKINLIIYLSYLNKKINICWINNLYSYDDEMSLRRILKKIYMENDEYKKESYKKIDYSYKKKQTVKLDNMDFVEDISPVAWRDLDFCPKKFFLSNVFHENPVYTEDFHQRLAFAAFSKLINLSNIIEIEFKKYVFDLFPQWSYTLKENLYYTTFKKNIHDEYRFKNISFPKYIDTIHILRSRIYDNGKRKYRNHYKEEDINPRKYKEELLKEITDKSITYTKGEHCNMCPHLNICTKGAYSVDRARG